MLVLEILFESGAILVVKVVDEAAAKEYCKSIAQKDVKYKRLFNPVTGSETDL